MRTTDGASHVGTCSTKLSVFDRFRDVRRTRGRLHFTGQQLPSAILHLKTLLPFFSSTSTSSATNKTVAKRYHRSIYTLTQLVIVLILQVPENDEFRIRKRDKSSTADTLSSDEEQSSTASTDRLWLSGKAEQSLPRVVRRRTTLPTNDPP